MNTDRLNGITTFVRAVQAGSFSLAAERMNLTRSAVGKTIARLEQRLGVLLFQRTSRKQKLTTEGQVYYERCLRALAELDAADAELNSGRLQPQGVLRISAPKLIGRCARLAAWRDRSTLNLSARIEQTARTPGQFPCKKRIARHFIAMR